MAFFPFFVPNNDEDPIVDFCCYYYLLSSIPVQIVKENLKEAILKPFLKELVFNHCAAAALEHGFSSENTQQDLFNEYQQDRV